MPDARASGGNEEVPEYLDVPLEVAAQLRALFDQINLWALESLLLRFVKYFSLGGLLLCLTWAFIGVSETWRRPTYPPHRGVTILARSPPPAAGLFMPSDACV